MPSSLSLAGRRVAVKRPSVRGVDGQELNLPSWKAWSARDPLEQRAIEQMLVAPMSQSNYNVRLPLLVRPVAVTLNHVVIRRRA